MSTVTTGCQAVRADKDDKIPRPHGRALTLLAADFGRYYAVVHRYLVHRLFDAELAEELTAATFYKAVTAPRRVGEDPRHVQRWLLRVATNLANTHHRRKRRHQLLLRRFPYTRPMPTEQHADADAGREQDSSRVRAALMTLRPRYQAVVVLRYYSQLSLQEIAEVLGCRQDAVRTRLSRAMKTMRQRLGPRRQEHDTSRT
jgi:RNA polymerase sigma factor (sigma-70 family)